MQFPEIRSLAAAVLLLLLLLMPEASVAADYAFSSGLFPTYNYISASTGGTALDLGDDAVSAPIDLGFTFDFYGTPYTQVIVGSNGIIGFPGATNGLDTTTLLPTIPDGTDPNAVIAPLSTDLDPSRGGSIYTFSGGAAGERYFVVEWVGVPVKGEGGSRTFEAVLYEDNSDILFQYRTLRGGKEIIDVSTPVTGNTSAGIENQDGTVGLFQDASTLEEGQSILFSVTDPDNDGDGMIDRFEDFFGLDSSADDALDDKDADGRGNLQEFQAGTNPNQADSDGDGILDGADADPLDMDADKDGIQDSNEDQNNDGIVDAGETDPALWDTDGDGYNDGMEITYHTDPLDASSVPSLSGYTMVSGTTLDDIQNAMDTASAGAILYLPSQTYVPDTAPGAITGLTINKSVTLIGADPDSTLVQGDVTITGVGGVVLTGFTIEDAPGTAVTILGDASAPTKVRLVNMTLKNCKNGVLVSDLPASGVAMEAVLDQVRFTVTQPMQVGYGVRIEGLADATDRAEVRNSSFSLTGSGGGVVISDAANVIVSGNFISQAYDDAVTVGGTSSAVTLSRNTLSSNGGSGIRISDTASADIQDNAVSGNTQYGIVNDSTGTVANSGNSVTSNGAGNYSGSLDQAETAADVTGAVLSGRVVAESAAWITAASGGTVALINPSEVTTDPIFSLFGTSITLGPDTLSTDTFVTVSTSWESLPALPISFSLAMPAAEISLKDGALSGTADLTLPVLAGYSAERARLFHLVNGEWQEIELSAQTNYGRTFLHQQISFTAASLSPFELVIDLPVVDPGDPGGGGGCGLGGVHGEGNDSGNLLDAIVLLLPAGFLIVRRRRVCAVGPGRVQE